MTELTARELLLLLYDTALDAVDGRYLVNQWRQKSTANNPSFTHCVAIGKASAAMLQGAFDCVPSIKKSLLICPPSKITRQLKKNKNLLSMVSSHPVPDERSIAAGNALIDFLATMNSDDSCLFLISGGCSSFVEVPIDGINLQQLQEVNRYLLASGKDIIQINSWRQQFSKIKGGGLLHYLKTRKVTQLLLSDVKDDKAAFIGSGLLLNTSAVPEHDEFLSAMMPAHIDCLPISTKIVDTHIVGNLALAMQAVDETAKIEGYASYLHPEFLEGDASEAANCLYEKLRDAPKGIHIWGGETTVQLPERPGIGGRNLTLALTFAKNLTNQPNIHLLAAGTDGVDGNSRCAGAVVSMRTPSQAKEMGFDLQQEIDKANAGIVLMATDDLVQGEHSNTNVMDIVIAYIF